TFSTITVPPSNTFHFFQPLVSGGYFVHVLKGSQSISNTQFKGGEELSGPAQVIIQASQVSDTPDQYGLLFSYYATDQAAAQDNGIVATPTGHFEVTVEKSTNLTNWYPAIIKSLSEDSSAFFRLKISK